MGTRLRTIVKWALLMLCIIWISFYISNNWLQLVLIQGNSMSPSYHNCQMVLLNHRVSTFNYGDVVAFECINVKGVLIKRVVAVPGDKVHIIDGTLYINGKHSTVYPKEIEISYAGIANEEIVLQQDEYFVMGDNVEYSKDSRYEEIGCVQENKILGKVLEFGIDI